jgi:hypothetical protein
MRLAAILLLASTAAHAEQVGLKCTLLGTSVDAEWHILVDTDRQVYSARLERGAVFKVNQPAILNAQNPEPGSAKLNLHVEPNTFGGNKYWLTIKPDHTAYTSSMMGNFLQEAGKCQPEKATEF